MSVDGYSRCEFCEIVLEAKYIETVDVRNRRVDLCGVCAGPFTSETPEEKADASEDSWRGP